MRQDPARQEPAPEEPEPEGLSGRTDRGVPPAVGLQPRLVTPGGVEELVGGVAEWVTLPDGRMAAAGLAWWELAQAPGERAPALPADAIGVRCVGDEEELGARPVVRQGAPEGYQVPEGADDP